MPSSPYSRYSIREGFIGLRTALLDGRVHLVMKNPYK